MNYKQWALCTLGLCGVVSSSFAVQPSSPAINQTGLFLSLGGSYNLIRHSADTAGMLHAIEGFPPIGIFSGSNASYTYKQEALSPQIELGYFQPLKGSNWLGGIELVYSRITNTVSSPAAGTGAKIDLINSSGNTADQMTMNYSHTKIKDKLMLPIFIGHSYLNGFIYLGAGPAIFRINNTVTYSDSLSGYYVGDVGENTRRKWVSGGAIQTGLAYYFNPTWFFKLNYTYAKTSHYRINTLDAFSPALNNGLNTGILSLSTNHYSKTQDLTLSISKVFSI